MPQTVTNLTPALKPLTLDKRRKSRAYSKVMAQLSKKSPKKGA